MFVEILQETQQQVSVGERRVEYVVLSSWLRPTEQRELFVWISKVFSFSLKVHYVDTGRTF